MTADTTTPPVGVLALACRLGESAARVNESQEPMLIGDPLPPQAAVQLRAVWTYGALSELTKAAYRDGYNAARKRNP